MQFSPSLPPTMTLSSSGHDGGAGHRAGKPARHASADAFLEEGEDEDGFGEVKVGHLKKMKKSVKMKTNPFRCRNQ